MSASVAAAGFAVVPFGETCDACVIHSCTVTARADADLRRAARSARRRWPDAFVVLTGCAPEVSGAVLAERTGANLSLPRRDLDRLPEILGNHIGMPDANTRVPGALTPRFASTRAFLQVQNGCSYGCAYCIVPAARGAARSRLRSEVLDEAARLIEAGHREIVLTGANLGTWQEGRLSLVDLAEEVASVKGLLRLRIGSVEPTTVERPLLDLMASSPRICPHLHLPIQSGDDGVLAAMGRRYSTRYIAGVLEEAFRRVPLLGLGTDLIAGFPGETDAAFEKTIRLVKQFPFSNLHVFPFSERPGTRAASLPGRVPPMERRRRADRLIAEGRSMRTAFAAKFVGRRVSVLVEESHPDGSSTGWTGEYVEAVFPAGTPVNALVEGRVSAAGGERIIVEALSPTVVHPTPQRAQTG
jgi:threonylcarbamoyladenosine tRNA methylthiotransferase MtaB